jgi:hypothetical protein
LLTRARTRGSRAALDELEAYLAAPELIGTLTLAIAGLDVSATVPLGLGISLIPWSAVPEHSRKRLAIPALGTGFDPFRAPSAALVRDFSFERLYVPESQHSFDLSKPDQRLDPTELTDALQCIGLIGPCSPDILGHWVCYPETIPVQAGAISIPRSDALPGRRPLSQTEEADAQALISNFRALDESTKRRLRLAISRLTKAMQRPSPIDAAIDLGIAFEILFLNDQSDDHGELTYRLRIRASRLLGDDPNERKRIFKLLGNLYSHRSTAVHSGKLSTKAGKVPVHQLLQEGFAIAAATARRYIAAGPPEWDQVELG